MNLRSVAIVVISVILVVIAVSLITMSVMPSNKAVDNFSNEQKNDNLSEERFLAPASDPFLVDTFNSRVSRVTVDEQVLIQSEITNRQDKAQPFLYIVQVKNSEGITTLLSWIRFELPVNEKLKAAQSWIPEVQGKYDIEIFVWDSIEGRTVLSPTRKISVEVLEF